MLKLTYTESGLLLEQVTASLDAIATQRVMLAVYTGEPLHLIPGRAAFLISADIAGLLEVRQALFNDPVQIAAIVPVDEAFVEICLHGTWIADSPNANTGLFFTALSPTSERLIGQLWQASQRQLAASY